MKYSRHYEATVPVNAKPEVVFAYADDHANFSSHMNQPSWVMGGKNMKTELDEGGGKRVGSHIRVSGTILGIHLFLDEIVIQREPPYRKSWETVGDINLLVIDHYKLGYEILPSGKASNLRVYIDYNLPKSWKTLWLGFIFGRMYSKWCVSQIISDVRNHFSSNI